MFDELYVSFRQALIGGAIAAFVAIVAVLVSGSLSGVESRLLLETIAPSVRFLSSSIMTASATIMALMLTVLSLSHRSNQSFEREHYQRIKQVSLLDAIAFVASVLLLQILSVPLSESSEIPTVGFTILYYLVVFAAAAIGGLVVTIVLTLYQISEALITHLSPSASDPAAGPGHKQSKEKGVPETRPQG